MAGKADKRGSLVDDLKSMGTQTDQNYGLLRAGQQGAPNQRDYSIGTANNDYDSTGRLLSIFGGVMLGALGYNKVGTEQLASSGIVDTGDYNASRLTINNNGAYTLKVLLPIYKAGQQVWISALIGQSWTIQNTLGNGDETTGNIELLQQTDYSMANNDWICFQYDANDEKFHQVSAGINDVGAGSSGEVFSWTADHSSGNFDLLMRTGDIFFGASSTSGSIRELGSTMYIYAGTTNVYRASSTLTSFLTNVRPHSDSTYTLGTSSRYWSDFFTDNITMQSGGDIDMSTSTISDCGQIQQNANARHYFGNGGNYIFQNSSNGNLEYRTSSTSVDHSFFVGSLRMNINKDTIEMRNDIDMTNNKILDVRFIQSDSSVGFTESYIKMGDTSTQTTIVAATTLGFSDITGVFFTSGEFGLSWARDMDPLLDDQYNLGSNSKAFQQIWANAAYGLEKWYSAGSAPPNESGFSRVFSRDNGAGKAELRVKFPSGTSVLIATEP